MCSVTLRPQDVGRGRGFDKCARRGGEFPVRGGQRIRLQLGQSDVLGLSGHGEMPQPDMQTFFEAVASCPSCRSRTARSASNRADGVTIIVSLEMVSRAGIVFGTKQ